LKLCCNKCNYLSTSIIDILIPFLFH
jgi:hypothetical protein